MSLSQYKTVDTPTKTNTTVGQFISELHDPQSIWYDLTVAEMSGVDYIFIPQAACIELQRLPFLQIFLIKIQALLGSAKTRLTLIAYHLDGQHNLRLEKYTVRWSNGKAVQIIVEDLRNSAQYEYVKTMYEHSEPLV